MKQILFDCSYGMFIQLKEGDMTKVSERDFPWQLGTVLLQFLKSNGLKGIKTTKIDSNVSNASGEEDAIKKIKIETKQYQIATIKKIVPEPYCHNNENGFGYYPAFWRLVMNPNLRWKQLKFHFYCHSVDSNGNLRGYGTDSEKQYFSMIEFAKYLSQFDFKLCR